MLAITKEPNICLQFIHLCIS